MNHKIKSIRPFIGAKDFEISRSFYRDLGFEETVLDTNFSVFKSEQTAFYLQDYYTKDWIENTMIFLEVDDVDRYYKELLALNLPEKYEGVKLTSYLGGATFDATNEYYPIPQRQIDLTGDNAEGQRILAQNPGY